MSGFISGVANALRSATESPQDRKERELLIANAKFIQVAAGITAIALTILFATVFPTLIGMALYIPSIYVLYEVGMVAKNLQEIGDDGLTHFKASWSDKNLRDQITKNTLIARYLLS